MATRDVMDNRIDVWKDAYKDDQQLWRVNASTTGNYGQVLRGNVRPSDQPEDGPLLPPLLKNEGWIDVYEASNGFGWQATFEATEGADVYYRTLGSHEDGPLVETTWVLWPSLTLFAKVRRLWAPREPGATLWRKVKAILLHKVI